MYSAGQQQILIKLRDEVVVYCPLIIQPHNDVLAGYKSNGHVL